MPAARWAMAWPSSCAATSNRIGSMSSSVVNLPIPCPSLWLRSWREDRSALRAGRVNDALVVRLEPDRDNRVAAAVPVLGHDDVHLPGPGLLVGHVQQQHVR